jgi:hypothetical protein
MTSLSPIQIRLAELEKEIGPTLTYSESNGFLKLVTCVEVYYSLTVPNIENSKGPRCALMLGMDYLFHPSLCLYSDYGIEGVTFNSTTVNTVENSRELGVSHLNYREISRLGRFLFSRLSLAEIYNHTELIFDAIVRLATRGGSLISGFSNSDYFGLTVIAQRGLIEANELDQKIRTDFAGQMPKLEPASGGCQIS